jgi:hypothetical protein
VHRTIQVTADVKADGWTCHVGIEDDGRLVSEHTVTVRKEDKERFGPESTVEELVTRSFEFLLEREAPTSILRRFGLADIERYFPEYPTTIRV